MYCVEVFYFDIADATENRSLSVSVCGKNNAIQTAKKYMEAINVTYTRAIDEFTGELVYENVRGDEWFAE